MLCNASSSICYACFTSVCFWSLLPELGVFQKHLYFQEVGLRSANILPWPNGLTCGILGLHWVCCIFLRPKHGCPLWLVAGRLKLITFSCSNSMLNCVKCFIWRFKLVFWLFSSSDSFFLVALVVLRILSL